MSSWEAEKQANPNGKVKAGDRTGAKRKVEVQQRAFLQTKENLGVFWPEKIYKKKFGKKITKRDMTNMSHKGRILRGIILDESYGRAIGTIDVSSIDEVGVQKIGLLAESDSGLDNDVDGAMAAATKRLAVISRPSAKSEAGALKLQQSAGSSSCPAAPGSERAVARWYPVVILLAHAPGNRFPFTAGRHVFQARVFRIAMLDPHENRARGPLSFGFRG